LKYFVTARLSENIHETPEGFLVCVGVPIARTGEMIYGPGESPIKVGPDGKAIVTREAKELFRPETIASFEGKAFTLKHPEDFVNPKNWKVLAKGVLQNVRRGSGENENDMLADVLVTDHEAIALVKAGLREVSCGYEAEYIETGVGRGMQTNIIGNHLALVEEGRAGAAYAINDQKGAKMKKLSEKIKGIFAKAADEATKVVDEGGDEKETETGDEMPAWAEKLQKQNLALQKQVKDAVTQMGSMAKAGDKEEEEKSEDADDPDKKKDAMDEAPAWAKDMVKCMNAMMDKLGKGKDADKDDDDDKSEDAEEEEESEDADADDDDFEETPASTSKDEAARIEILAPGLKAKGKDAKRVALLTAYKSKDHKVIIDTLNGGKAVDFKKASAKTIDHLFIGASEMIGLARTKDFSKWKQVRDTSASEGGEPMSADKINEINEKFYAAQRSH